MIKYKGKDYTKAVLKLMGIGGINMAFVSKQSCFNQDYYDAITRLPDNIHVQGCKVHVFYALKMGKKYKKRYLQHFVDVNIHEQHYEHEELLMCYPQKWIQELKKCCLS